MTTELWRLGAVELADSVRRKDVACREATTAMLAFA
ncbi:MAG: hypothetical protein JWQ03_1768 [Variovorax sp.]|nr:hypothetical protein [Variovorax sp.]